MRTLELKEMIIVTGGFGEEMLVAGLFLSVLGLGLIAAATPFYPYAPIYYALDSYDYYYVDYYFDDDYYDDYFYY